jgi:hypothetical protein
MFRLLVPAVACLAGAALASPPPSAPPSAPSLSERAARAERVVLAEIGARRTLVPDGNVRRMLTLTQVAVVEDLKGAGPAQLTVVQAGGKSGLWESHATGDARLEAGERAVLFLLVPDAAKPDACTLYGLGLGKLEVRGDEVIVSGSGDRRPLAEVSAEIRRAALDRTPAAGGTR